MFQHTISLEEIDNISPEKLAELKTCFNSFDDDDSGTITKQEFSYALTRLNIYIESGEIQGLFNEFDTDGNNTLEFEEFLKLVARLDPKLGQEIEINKAFKLFDHNQDGFITRGELMEGLTQFGVNTTEDDIDLLFLMTDDNKDGLINHAEFRNILYDVPVLETPSLPSRPGSENSSPAFRRKESCVPSPQTPRQGNRRTSHNTMGEMNK